MLQKFMIKDEFGRVIKVEVEGDVEVDIKTTESKVTVNTIKEVK